MVQGRSVNWHVVLQVTEQGNETVLVNAILLNHLSFM